MVQSPSWEANWFAASQEIPRISWNPKVHYRTHKRPPPVSILGQPNPVHIPTSHLLEIHSNIIHPSMPGSPQWSPSLWFPHQDPILGGLMLLYVQFTFHLLSCLFLTTVFVRYIFVIWSTVMDTFGKRFALQVRFVQLVFIYQNTACTYIVRHGVDVHMCNSAVSFAFSSADLTENAESYSEACCVSLSLRTVATAVSAICKNCDKSFSAEFESSVLFFF